MVLIQSDGLIGTRLAAARKTVGLTQRDLAAALGVSVRTIQNYEAGKIVPFRHLDELGALLGCTTGWLLNGREQAVVDAVLVDLRVQRDRLRANLRRQRDLLAQLHSSVPRRG